LVEWNRLTYGGNGHSTSTIPADYIYPGTSDSANGNVNWVHPGFADDRAVASSGPFTFNPGQILNYKLAYVFGRDYSSTGTNLTSLDVTKARVDSIRNRFSSNRLAGCYSSTLGIKNSDGVHTSVYPNPNNGILHITSSEMITAIEVRDINSKLVSSVISNSKNETIDLSSQPSGIYFVSVTTNTSVKVNKIILNK
jgi:hypothetical protein